MNTKSRRNLIIIGGAMLLLLAFFTNPDQAAHLTAIKQTAALRNPGNSSTTLNDGMFRTTEYNNYLVFSTTSWASKTLTYGYFGQIQTTNEIEIFWGVFK